MNMAASLLRESDELTIADLAEKGKIESEKSLGEL